MRKFAIAALVLAGLAAAAPVVYGQAGAPDASAAQQHRERAARLPGERIEARLAYAKTALKILPEQDAQWNALAGVLRRQAREMSEQIQNRRSANRDQPPTAIERLELRQQLLATASARMTDLLDAAKPLYATFSDDQKKIADQLLDRGGHRFGRWH
ncbi:MAG: Spy/CpxP family protein refolding chaperone [Proteobacteria bacterium]|nr:Spy/CpxP family protein refolding chaperone [Pseudomonadota bacterium]